MEKWTNIKSTYNLLKLEIVLFISKLYFNVSKYSKIYSGSEYNLHVQKSKNLKF